METIRVSVSPWWEIRRLPDLSSGVNDESSQISDPKWCYYRPSTVFIAVFCLQTNVGFAKAGSVLSEPSGYGCLWLNDEYTTYFFCPNHSSIYPSIHPSIFIPTFPVQGCKVPVPDKYISWRVSWRVRNYSFTRFTNIHTEWSVSLKIHSTCLYRHSPSWCCKTSFVSFFFFSVCKGVLPYPETSQSREVFPVSSQVLRYFHTSSLPISVFLS